MDARQPHGDGRRARPTAWAAAVVLWSVLPVAAEAAQRVALVIGNSAYEHTDPLRNPGNDAAGMASALGRLGFEAVLGTDLDLDGFYDTLGEFDEASRGADATLFFYAGHGLQVRGKSWLAPAVVKHSPDPFEGGRALAQAANLGEPPVVAGGAPEVPLDIDAVPAGLPAAAPPDRAGAPYVPPGQFDEGEPAAPTPKAVEKDLGLSREDRRLVQMGLASVGHDPGPADGMFGGRTRRALRAWQESKEVEATGYLTKEQGEELAALGRDESERKAREAEHARSPVDKFRDCPECPEMVVVPGGPFGRPFAVGMYEVTFGEWDAACRTGAVAGIGRMTGAGAEAGARSST